MNLRIVTFASVAALGAVGCVSLKTESEIKPIHITMDINLKVDKELDKVFSDENMSKPKGQFKEVKDLLDRKVAGLNNKAMLEARPGATDEDKIRIAEANMRRTQRFAEIAKSSGVAVESVQQRSVKKFDEKVPAGSGVWLQSADGAWRQK